MGLGLPDNLDACLPRRCRRQRPDADRGNGGSESRERPRRGRRSQHDHVALRWLGRRELARPVKGYEVGIKLVDLIVNAAGLA